jgi:hypothetical protein
MIPLPCGSLPQVYTIITALNSRMNDKKGFGITTESLFSLIL